MGRNALHDEAHRTGLPSNKALGKELSVRPRDRPRRALRQRPGQIHHASPVCMREAPTALLCRQPPWLWQSDLPSAQLPLPRALRYSKRYLVHCPVRAGHHTKRGIPQFPPLQVQRSSRRQYWNDKCYPSSESKSSNLNLSLQRNRVSVQAPLGRCFSSRAQTLSPSAPVAAPPILGFD